jgi:hypothetical protein
MDLLERAWLIRDAANAKLAKGEAPKDTDWAITLMQAPANSTGSPMWMQAGANAKSQQAQPAKGSEE